jgi:hypothetical protein
MKSPAKSFKWIFFRVINYLHIVIGLFIIVMSIISNWPLRFVGVAEFFGFLLAMLGFGIFVANGLSNLYLVERFFPDQLPPGSASRFNMLTYILLIIFSSLLIILVFALLFSSLDDAGTENAFPLVAWIFLVSLVSTSIPLWFLQPNLRSTLKKNYYTNFDQFLENDTFPEIENE